MFGRNREPLTLSTIASLSRSVRARSPIRIRRSVSPWVLSFQRGVEVHECIRTVGDSRARFAIPASKPLARGVVSKGMHPPRPVFGTELTAMQGRFFRIVACRTSVGWRAGRVHEHGTKRPGHPAAGDPARYGAVRARGHWRRSPRAASTVAMVANAGEEHPDSGNQEDHERLHEPVIAAIGNACVKQDGDAGAHARSSRRNSLRRRSRSASRKRRSVSTITGSSR